MKARTILTTLLLLASLALSQACPVCGPGSGQKASDAASYSILFLLGVIILVMGGIGSFVVSLNMRGRK
jgi:uncharacterized protein (DUF983 family)